MRKGRSQRKTRGSLPPTSKRPQSRLASASLEMRETLSQREPLTTPTPRLELVEEVARLELVREPEQPEQPEHVHADARVETLTFHLTERAAVLADDEAVNAAPTAAVKSEPHVTSLPTPDEMSIPPMGDLSVEPIADRFFSEGELVAARAGDEEEEWDDRANKAARKSLPEVVQRRARLAKYVRWAVGGAAVVCLAALARTALPPSASQASGSLAALESRPSPPAAKAASVAVAVAAAEPAKTADAVSAPVVAVPAQAAEPSAETARAAEIAPAAKPVETVAAVPADAPVAPAVAAVATSDKTALQEKNDSRRALERGKLADAIAAGERSVALDPTDGEAWLLLGAAYQEKGKNADARRCYSSCVKEGKRGPLGECRALIH